MNYILIIVGSFTVLGILAYGVSRWPDQSAKKKKEKREPVPAPEVQVKETAALTERFERRVRSLENALTAAQHDQRDKLKEIESLKAEIHSLNRQVEQEKAWREKEEAFVIKEKKVEQDLRADLEKTRTELHAESNRRIRQDYELNELRQAKDSLSSDLRKTGGQNNDLETRVKGFIEETRMLKAENAQLRQKKEADQWVAKDDHVRIEKQLTEQLRQAKREIELLKMRLPVDLRDVNEKDKFGT